MNEQYSISESYLIKTPQFNPAYSRGECGKVCGLEEELKTHAEELHQEWKHFILETLLVQEKINSVFKSRFIGLVNSILPNLF